MGCQQPPVHEPGLPEQPGNGSEPLPGRDVLGRRLRGMNVPRGASPCGLLRRDAQGFGRQSVGRMRPVAQFDAFAWSEAQAVLVDPLPDGGPWRGSAGRRG